MSSSDTIGLFTKGRSYDEQSVFVHTKTLDEISLFVRGKELFVPVYEFLEAEITDFKLTSNLPVNEVTIRFGYDIADGLFLGSVTRENTISKLVYGADPQFKVTYDMKMIQSQRTANIIADAICKSSGYPEILATFKHDIRSLFTEENDPVTITHLAGLGESGYVDAEGYVVSRNRSKNVIEYVVSMVPPELYQTSTLVRLTTAQGTGAQTLSVTYDDGVATITIYADTGGSPVVKNAKVIINGITKLTNEKGQAFFNLAAGSRYTALVQASGYEDLTLTFTT